MPFRAKVASAPAPSSCTPALPTNSLRSLAPSRPYRTSLPSGHARMTWHVFKPCHMLTVVYGQHGTCPSRLGALARRRRPCPPPVTPYGHGRGMTPSRAATLDCQYWSGVDQILVNTGIGQIQSATPILVKKLVKTGQIQADMPALPAPLLP